MKEALVVLGALLLVAGCSPVSPQANQPPNAYVSTVPDEVSAGDTVLLGGYGRDEDGSVEGYLWSSDLDGELSRSATFEIDSLSLGEHVVSFSVQDNNGAWSETVLATLKVMPAVEIVPTVDYFTATPATIRAGQSALLSWRVSNATAVAIDQGVGSVSGSGSVSVSPGVTTTYILTAVHDTAMTTAMVTVAVEAAEVAVLTGAPDMSGYVRFSGYAPYGDVYVGDDEADRGIRGYITYYIHDIPRNALITRVRVDMSGYAVPHADPFTGLDCLSVFEHPYNTLQGQYRLPGLPGAIEQWCSLSDLEHPRESEAFRTLLQSRLGEERLQVRLQFAERETDVDQTRDLLVWRGSTYPKLTVEYYVG